MPPKRKADATNGRPSKRAASGANTPVSLNHASDDSDYVFDEEEEESVANVDSNVKSESSIGRAFAAKTHIFTDTIATFSLSTYTGKDKKKNKSDDVSQHFKRDFSHHILKPDHKDRPLWIDPDRGRITVETFNPLGRQALDFLTTIAEPQSRPSHFHEFTLNTHSLYAAVSVGLSADDVINNLEKFSKVKLPDSLKQWIKVSTGQFGKVKLVLKHNTYYLESSDPHALQVMLKDPVIGPCRMEGTEGVVREKAPTMGGLVIPGTKNAEGVQQPQQRQQDQQFSRQARLDGDSDDDEDIRGPTDEELFQAIREDDDEDEEEGDQVHTFQVPREKVEMVKQRCLEINYPITEEYDFRNDQINPDLNIDLRPNARIRYYQEYALSKQFGNGRARSGIIVLPCGAGKTLVGITAACTMKKSILIICNSAMSVVQWRTEFLKWSNISAQDIALFTAEHKERFNGNAGIVITNYTMMGKTEGRAFDTQKVMDFLKNREWGLMILDEVHVAPANIFRKVTSNIASHAKLGLTATLLREDDKIKDLNFLIGPKLYEANWMELADQGHIARVQCAEVWCPMPSEFYTEYLKSTSRRRMLLYTMNPKKFQACQFLMDYHESRGDKIIVFSDNVYALEAYAKRLHRAFIYGETSQQERLRILENFQHNDAVNTIFLSKIGDTSLDLPEATCLIQISSHYGSRRQEAQRLGRILRAKRRNDEGFNAFFYSLVSKDTAEMYYSSKRQAFLVDQGYAFKVITHLQGQESLPNLAFRTPQERKELLMEVMLQAEASGVTESVRGDQYERQNARNQVGRPLMNGGPTVKRMAGSLADLAGGQDMAYVEYGGDRNKELKKAGGKGKKGGSSDAMTKIRREAERERKRKAENAKSMV